MDLHKGRRPAAPRDLDDGFSLIEVLVALFSLALVSIVAATFLVDGVRTTEQQSQAQNAVSVATQALEAVQSVPVSQVLLGRRQPDVQALVNSPTFAPLLVDDVVATGNFDATATAASVPVIPITTTQTLKGLTYQVRTSIDTCYLDRVARKCLRSSTVGIPVLRATVNVQWGIGACTRCSYSSSVLLDKQVDPIFSSRLSEPIIVTVTPSQVQRSRGTPVSLTGTQFVPGLTLTTTGASTFTNIVVSADGKSLTAQWNSGAGLGSSTLVLTNPDGGRAEYTPIAVTK